MFDTDAAPDHPPDNQIGQFIWTYFPWAWDKRTLALLAVIALAACALTIGAISAYTASQPAEYTHPPGTNGAGISDHSLLTTQHDLTLNTTSHRATLALQIITENGTQNVEHTYLYNASTQNISGESTTPQMNYSLFRGGNADTTYFRLAPGENETDPTYNIGRTAPEHTFKKLLNQRLQWFNTTPNGTTTTDSGLLVRQYDITGFDEANATNVNTTKYGVSGTLSVTESGFIHNYEATVTASDSEFKQTESLTITPQNETVPAPDWLDDAKNSSG